MEDIYLRKNKNFNWMYKQELWVAINSQKVNMFFYALDNLMEHSPCLILIHLKVYTVFRFRNKKLIQFQLINQENGLHLLRKLKVNYLCGSGNQRHMWWNKKDIILIWTVLTIQMTEPISQLVETMEQLNVGQLKIASALLLSQITKGQLPI